MTLSGIDGGTADEKSAASGIAEAMGALARVFSFATPRTFRIDVGDAEVGPVFHVHEGVVEVFAHVGTLLDDPAELLSRVAVQLCECTWSVVDVALPDRLCEHRLSVHELLLGAGRCLFPVRSLWYRDVHSGLVGVVDEAWGLVGCDASGQGVVVDGPEVPDAAILGIQEVGEFLRVLWTSALQDRTGILSLLAPDGRSVTIARNEAFALVVVHRTERVGQVLSTLCRLRDVEATRFETPLPSTDPGRRSG